MSIKITTIGNNTVTMTYDDFGRQLTLTDPDAGTITYDYNSLGQLTFQQDARQAALSTQNSLVGIAHAKRSLSLIS